MFLFLTNTSLDYPILFYFFHETPTKRLLHSLLCPQVHSETLLSLVGMSLPADGGFFFPIPPKPK